MTRFRSAEDSNQCTIKQRVIERERRRIYIAKREKVSEKGAYQDDLEWKIVLRTLTLFSIGLQHPTAQDRAVHRPNSCPIEHLWVVHDQSSPYECDNGQAVVLFAWSLKHRTDESCVSTRVEICMDKYWHVAIVVRSSSMNGLSVCSKSSCRAYRHHSDSSYNFSHSSGAVAWSRSSLRAAVLLEINC